MLLELMLLAKFRNIDGYKICLQKQLGSIPSISDSPKRVAPCTSKKNLKKPHSKTPTPAPRSKKQILMT